MSLNVQSSLSEAPDLFYAQQRWYNAATGRFISEDPVWGEPKRPPSLHRYLYAHANPTVFVDPDGRMGLPNFQDEMPGYEPPEPCELCYVDATPEQKIAAYEALSPADRELMAGATEGMIRREGQMPMNTVMGAAAVVNAGVDVLSGGRLYGGSADRLAAGAESAVELLSNPVQNTRDHFDQIDTQFEALRRQGRNYEAGDLAAQGATDILGAGTMATGVGSLGTSVAKLAGKGARDNAAQLGQEVAGSPTVYYVREQTSTFVRSECAKDILLCGLSAIHNEPTDSTFLERWRLDPEETYLQHKRQLEDVERDIDLELLRKSVEKHLPEDE